MKVVDLFEMSDPDGETNSASRTVHTIASLINSPCLLCRKDLTLATLNCFVLVRGEGMNAEYPICHECSELKGGLVAMSRIKAFYLDIDGALSEQFGTTLVCSSLVRKG